MRISDKFRSRYAAPDVDVSFGISGDHLADRVQIFMRCDETGMMQRIEMTRAEARRLAASLIGMADQCDKGQQDDQR